MPIDLRPESYKKNSSPSITVLFLMIIAVCLAIVVGVFVFDESQPDPSTVVSVNGAIAVVEKPSGARVPVSNAFPDLKPGDLVVIQSQGSNLPQAIIEVR